MLEFKQGMDTHSWEIRFHGKFIGFLQDHDGPFRVVFYIDSYAEFPISVLEEILEKKDELEALKWDSTIITESYKRLCEFAPEIQVYYLIYSVAGFDDLNSELEASQSVNLAAREKVQYAATQTKRFGIKKPRDARGRVTPTFWEWFFKWGEYTSSLSTKDWEYLFEVFEEVSVYLEAHPGPVPEEIVHGLKRFRPITSEKA